MALLYWFMARWVFGWLRRFIPVKGFELTLAFLDGHKDLHVFFAKCLGWMAFIHVVSHLLGSAPVIDELTGDTPGAAELNRWLKCADPDERLKFPEFYELIAPVVAWPRCPLANQSHAWRHWRVALRLAHGCNVLFHFGKA